MIMTESSSMQATVQEIITSLKDKPGALLPILHGIQNALGYVPAETVPVIATALKLSRAEVHGVITFYHYFRDTKPGKHTIHLCRAESCQAMGGKDLEAHVKTRLGIDFHETTADGQFLWNPSIAWATALARRPCKSARRFMAAYQQQHSMRLLIPWRN